MGGRMETYACSGSCFNPTIEIKGKVIGGTFFSSQFEGNVEDETFYDRLLKLAKQTKSFVRLVY